MKSYTKGSPKVQDYNPLTHTSFYNPPSVFSTPGYQSRLSPPFSSLLNKSSDKSVMSISKVASKNIFAQSGYNISRSSSMDSFNRDPIYSKTRPKNRVTDPISGEVKVYNIERPKIESLDVNVFRDKLTSDNDYKPIDIQFKKNNIKAHDTMSGSLRKEVPGVAYVDPFQLKSSIHG
ncbi:hypothetical protein SteCoe_23013 [Stentor coeruleus]|uniref:Uncharacterized protein n=1 Tax=Stentor coeruleus TaxID=5963 RepID=A0A1R2BL28_9CILI|nr:hypothetical protein SteCoe_23013 [Stentor coeruleus]